MVSVVIVNWNGLRDLPACLDSVRRQTYRPLEIIVVDNASTDGSSVYLKQQPDIICIQNSSNRGFAAANNQGLARSQGEWVFLLNSDARLHEACLEILLNRVAMQGSVGSASPKIYRGTGPLLDSTGIILQKKKFSPADRGELQLDVGQFDRADCEWIFGPTAAAALYRREALADCKIAGEIFDEDFFAYYEDVDLAWRLQLLGWKSLYVPQAIAYHDRKGPLPKAKWLQRRAFANRYFCYVKNEIPRGIKSYLFRALPYELGRCLYLFLRRPYMAGALLVFLAKLPLYLKKRRWIQSRRCVTADEMSRFD